MKYLILALTLLTTNAIANECVWNFYTVNGVTYSCMTCGNITSCSKS